MAYYDGTKLLSLNDINGSKPEIYICTTNRTGGKTTYFGRLVVNRFLERGEKFAILYRYKYELDNCAEKFFKDIGALFFKKNLMTSKKRASGIYHELFLDGNSCGYALSINSADNIKKNSHLFNDVQRMIFDEFQSETANYCPNEVSKLISIHTSIARGQGEQVRYVPLFMISNPVSLINPYYVEMGISKRLTPDVKFLRGDGWVLEQGYIESAAEAQRNSAFNRAFSDNDYVAFSAESNYLNDNYSFVEKMTGVSRYLATIKYRGRDYALREFKELGYIYCDDRPDLTFPFKIVVTKDDHSVNYVMLRNNDLFLASMRYYFEKGCFRFKDLKCKEAVLEALSY